MLVIGFGDMYAKADVSEDAANAIEEFINSGKAVLFSHDTVAFSVLRADEYKTTKPKQSASAGIGKVYEGAYASGYSLSGSKSTAGGYWSGNISTRFRSLVGMDRYNVKVSAGTATFSIYSTSALEIGDFKHIFQSEFLEQ